MAFWNRKKHRELPKKFWITPDGKVERLSLMVFESEHTLIAGATGCGKSTLLHGIMRDLLIHYAPSEARLVLIDPKRVELSRYRDLPHTERYVATSEGAVEVLREVERMMMERYKLMESRGEGKYSGAHYFVVIDELAPLMLKTNPNRKYFQPLMQNILQLGRAASIHVIACTQAPNRQVIPAELVLNFTLRIGMSCGDKIESRQIIGTNGCEVLPKHGKAIVRNGSEWLSATLENTSRAEVNDVIRYWQSDRCWKIA